MRSAPAFEKDVPSPIPSSIRKSTAFLARVYKITQGFRLEPTSNLAFGDYNVIINSSYGELQGPLEAADRHAAIIGMCINASKAKVMSALIPDEQRQAVLLDGEPVEDIEKFNYLGSMFVAKDHRSGDQEQD